MHEKGKFLLDRLDVVSYNIISRVKFVITPWHVSTVLVLQKFYNYGKFFGIM